MSFKHTKKEIYRKQSSAIYGQKVGPVIKRFLDSGKIVPGDRVPEFYFGMSRKYTVLPAKLPLNLEGSGPGFQEN